MPALVITEVGTRLDSVASDWETQRSPLPTAGTFLLCEKLVSSRSSPPRSTSASSAGSYASLGAVSPKQRSG